LVPLNVEAGCSRTSPLNRAIETQDLAVLLNSDVAVLGSLVSRAISLKGSPAFRIFISPSATLVLSVLDTAIDLLATR
jgi:hypothetical protein